MIQQLFFLQRIHNDDRSLELWSEHYTAPYTGDPSKWVNPSCGSSQQNFFAFNCFFNNLTDTAIMLLCFENIKFLSSECIFSHNTAELVSGLFIQGTGSLILHRTCAFKSKGSQYGFCMTTIMPQNGIKEKFIFSENSFIDDTSFSQGQYCVFIQAILNKSFTNINCSHNKASSIPTFLLMPYEEGCFTDISYCTFSNNVASQQFVMQVLDQAKVFRCNFINNVLGGSNSLFYSNEVNNVIDECYFMYNEVRDGWMFANVYSLTIRNCFYDELKITTIEENFIDLINNTKLSQAIGLSFYVAYECRTEKPDTEISCKDDQYLRVRFLRNHVIDAALFIYRNQ